MLLTIDVRKAHDTGIGTYIRQVVPRVLRAWPAGQVQVLVCHADAARYDFIGADVPMIETRARPFGLAEQYALRRFASEDRLFWATSLAHPLYTTGRLVNTVHDLAQLALPTELGGRRLKHWLAWPFFDSIRRTSDHVIHVSEFTAAEFRRLVGMPRAPQSTTPLGVDAVAFSTAGLVGMRPMAEPYFLMIGNLRPHKNLALVLAALELLGEALPHRVLLVGPGQSEHAVQALRRRHGAVVDRLVLGGLMDHDALLGALRHAEALLFPSHYEGFGLPVLEAMAAGCPVLVARNGVSPLVAGDQCLSFDPSDATSLAQVMMSQVSMGDSQRTQRVQAAIAHAAQASWDKTAQVTIDALLSATGRQRRAGGRVA